MEVQNISNTINQYLIEKLDMDKIQDSELKEIGDGLYFIDKDKSKYLICYTIFDNTSDLVKYWELYQNEYIAGNLQMKKYCKSDIRWDIYYMLVYNDENYISPEVELSIERDSFCCKKLCINGFNKYELLEQLKDKLPISKDYYIGEDSNIVSYKDFITRLCDDLDISIKDGDSFEENESVIYNILEIMGKKHDE